MMTEWIRWTIRVILSLISLPILIAAYGSIAVFEWAFDGDTGEISSLLKDWASGFEFPAKGDGQ